jgi:hypothetical protein
MSRWPLAGDQLYIEMDLSVTNLPPGSRLAIGEAVIEERPNRTQAVESSYSVLDSTP